MRICFIAPANNYHTIKWCTWFKNHGHEVHVISFIKAEIEGVNIHWIPVDTKPESGDGRKLLYLFKAIQVRKILKTIKPDIVNAHYATSYGAVMALSGWKKYIVSLWGTDIFEFPKKSLFHKIFLKLVLLKAPYIFSTSKAMADEASLYTKKKIYITPFGVDMELFNPSRRKRNDGFFYIGTVKTLDYRYGIDILLEAVSKIKKETPNFPIRVRIAGKGPMEEELKALAKKLQIDTITTWLGFISQEEAANEWANLDIAVIASRHESFGVSAVEAQASGCPVIVSDIPGLLESTLPGKTSITVSAGDVIDLEEKIRSLCENNDMREKMGKAGRAFASSTFDLNLCFERIENLFQKIC